MARVLIIAALCGAAVGLLQVGERRLDSPVPAFQDAIDDPLLMADAEYKFALFAKDVAAWAGVPGRMSPTPWEEKAVARYERLALATSPAPLACHRLAIIYAGRGYRQQAREMLMRALAQDGSGAEVYMALALVYSDDPIRPKDVAGTTELLRRQPTWWALTTLAEMARRLELPEVAESYEDAAERELWRFGLAVGLVTAGVVGIVALAVITLIVLGLRVLFSRYWGLGPTMVWALGLPTLSWLEILDVVALMVFLNALGQVSREALTADIAPDALLATGLRVAHYLLVAVPAILLVVSRSGSRWWLALGFQPKTTARHVMQGVVALGTALFGILLVQDLLTASFRVMVPGLGQVQPGPGAEWSSSASPASVITQFVLVIVAAPLLEEVVFRGYVFRGLLQRLRPLWAAALSAALFAGAHLPSAGSAFLSLMILGLVSAYTYRFTRSLVPSIVLHAGYNACIVATTLVLRM